MPLACGNIRHNYSGEKFKMDARRASLEARASIPIQWFSRFFTGWIYRDRASQTVVCL
jgi:hypothetical protein